MANKLSTRPWIIDIAAATVLWTGQIKIAHIEFSQYTADTDRAQIKNQNGDVVCLLDGAADLETVRSGKVGWINGLIVDRVDGGGIVRIYIE